MENTTLPKSKLDIILCGTRFEQRDSLFYFVQEMVQDPLVRVDFLNYYMGFTYPAELASFVYNDDANPLNRMKLLQADDKPVLPHPERCNLFEQFIRVYNLSTSLMIVKRDTPLPEGEEVKLEDEYYEYSTLAEVFNRRKIVISAYCNDTAIKAHKHFSDKGRIWTSRCLDSSLQQEPEVNLNVDNRPLLYRAVPAVVKFPFEIAAVVWDVFCESSPKMYRK